MATEAARPRALPPLFPVSPLVPVALAMAAGIVLDRHVAPLSTTRWAALAMGCAVAALLAHRNERGSRWVLAAAFVALGGARHHAFWSDLPSDDLARHAEALGAGMPAWVRGVLVDVPRVVNSDAPGETVRTVATVALTEIEQAGRWEPVSGRVRLSVAGDRSELRMGHPIEAAGALRAIGGPLNPGEFDGRLPLRTDGIRLRLSVGEARGVGPLAEARLWRAHAALGRARTEASRRLVEPLDPAIAPLAAALLLGRREGVDPEVNDAFACTGTTHLLAISGLHLQALALGLWGACSLLGLGRRLSAGVAMTAITLYAVLVGLEPSVVRSVAMTLTVGFGVLVHRSTAACPGNLLALAGLATLAINPAHLFDIGCQLSFLAVATLFWGVDPVLSWSRRTLPRPVLGPGRGRFGLGFHDPADPLDALERRLAPAWVKLLRRCGGLLFDSVVVSVLIAVVTAPLVAWRFHLVTPVGVLLNLPLVPVTSLALGVGGLSLPLAAAWPAAGHAMAAACGQLLAATESLVRWGAAQGWGHAYTIGPPGWWVIGVYGLIAAVVVVRGSPLPRRNGVMAAMAGWLAVGLVLGLLPGPRGRLEADVLAVGHGLAVVARTPDGATRLYDCGKQGDPRVGRRIIAPALWARGCRRIDAVILSHPDVDHFNGLLDLLDRFRVGRVAVGPRFVESAKPATEVRRLLDELARRGVPVVRLSTGALDPGGAIAVARLPSADVPGATDNEQSALLTLGRPGGPRLLLAGDLEGRGLAEVLATPATAFAGLVAPHHGSRGANPPALYDWGRPGAVLVSQEPPRPGSRDALAFLAARGVPVLRTWERGAIRLRWEADGLQFSGFLDPDRPVEAPARQLAGFGAGWAGLVAGVVDSVPVRVLIGVLGLIAGLGAVATLAVVEWGAWSLVRPGRPVEPAPVERPPWRPLLLTARDGAVLEGAVLEPAGGSRGVVLLLHGFAEDRTALRDRAEMLAARGWGVATLDLRGRGRSGGRFTTFGALEVDDVRAWIDAIERAGPFGSNPRWLAAWGRSMGAAIALRTAAQDGRIRALVLEAPYAELRQSVAAWLRRARIPGVLAGAVLWRAGRVAGAVLDRPGPIACAPRVRCPVLLVNGSDDLIAPVAEVDRLAAGFAVPPSRITVEGARHVDVFAVGGPELGDRIAAFLDTAPPGDAK